MALQGANDALNKAAAESAWPEAARLIGELDTAKTQRRGLEAQVGALKHDRRNQIVGYCVELAKWQV